jgi:hypothetical protein
LVHKNFRFRGFTPYAPRLHHFRPHALHPFGPTRQPRASPRALPSPPSIPTWNRRHPRLPRVAAGTPPRRSDIAADPRIGPPRASGSAADDESRRPDYPRRHHPRRPRRRRRNPPYGAPLLTTFSSALPPRNLSITLLSLSDLHQREFLTVATSLIHGSPRHQRVRSNQGSEARIVSGIRQLCSCTFRQRYISLPFSLYLHLSLPLSGLWIDLIPM